MAEEASAGAHSPTRRPDSPATLGRGFLGVAALSVASKGAAFLAAVLLARLLGAEGYGVFAFTMSVVALISVPVQLGLPRFLVRSWSVYADRGEHALMKGLLRSSLWVVLSLGCALALVGGWLIRSGSATDLVLDPAAQAVGLLLLPLLAVAAVLGGALSGLGKVLEGQLTTEALRPLLVLGLLVLVYVAGLELFPLHALGLQVLASVLVVAIGASLLRRHRPRDFAGSAPQWAPRAWLAGAAPFALIAAAQVANQNVDALMLGIWADAESVGVYRAATQTATLVVFGLLAVNAVIAPRLAALHAAGDGARLQQVVTFAARASLAVAAPVALVLFAMGESVLSLLFGDGFRGGYVALCILVAGQVLNAGAGSVGLILSMTGHAWHGLSGLLAGAVSNVLLNLLLIPRFGIEGAAIALLASLALWNGVLLVLVRSTTGIISLPVKLGRRAA